MLRLLVDIGKAGLLVASGGCRGGRFSGCFAAIPCCWTERAWTAGLRLNSIRVRATQPPSPSRVGHGDSRGMELFQVEMSVQDVHRHRAEDNREGHLHEQEERIRCDQHICHEQPYEGKRREGGGLG